MPPAADAGRFDVAYFLARRDDRTSVMLSCAAGMMHGPVCDTAEEAERQDRTRRGSNQGNTQNEKPP
jgi:hypothetical protein